MTDRFGPELRRLRTERGLSLGKLAELVPCNRGYVGQLEHGDRRPSATLARKLDDVLQAGGELVALARSDAHAPTPIGLQPDDEFDAFELARRATASDVSSTTLDGLEQAVDRLAVGYQGTRPIHLLPDVRRHLHYVGQLIDKRATLEQRRRLLVVGGWLSLLAATVHIDLHQRAPAGARLAAAVSLAEHTENHEIAAWCLETRAWDALTAGQYKLAAELSRAAQRVAPNEGSAFIQATAQEGRAWARLGEQRAARDALSRVERLASPLPMPDQPEHHYRYDPAKQHAYTATTLSWITDPAAETIAREVLARLESARDGGPRPRRKATARLDLALTLIRAGNLDEATSQAITAMNSGRIVPSSVWRVTEVLTAVEAAGLSDATDLRGLYEASFETAATA